MIEEIIVKSIESTFIPLAKTTVLICELCRYPRVIIAFAIGIFDEKHIIDQPEQRITDLIIFLRLILLGKIGSHFFLSINKVEKLIPSVTNRLQEALLDLLSEGSEEIVEKPILDERISVKVYIKMKSSCR